MMLDGEFGGTGSPCRVKIAYRVHATGLYLNRWIATNLCNAHQRPRRRIMETCRRASRNCRWAMDATLIWHGVPRRVALGLSHLATAHEKNRIPKLKVLLPTC